MWYNVVTMSSLDAAIGKINEEIQALKQARASLVRSQEAISHAKATRLRLDWRAVARSVFDDGEMHSISDVERHLFCAGFETVTSTMISRHLGSLVQRGVLERPEQNSRRRFVLKRES